MATLNGPRGPSVPKAIRKPSNAAKWNAFLSNNPAPYTALFAKGPALVMPKGTTFPMIIRASVKQIVTGNWETTTIRHLNATAVLIALADQGDFNILKQHFNGKAWNSVVAGSVDGFFSVFT